MLLVEDAPPIPGNRDSSDPPPPTLETSFDVDDEDSFDDLTSEKTTLIDTQGPIFKNLFYRHRGQSAVDLKILRSLSIREIGN